MGYTRLAIYLAGLVLVVLAAWVFLTQSPIGETVPAGIALAIILLLVGIGVMASAKSINDSRVSRRVVHDADVPPAATYTTRRTYDAAPPSAPAVERTRVYDTGATDRTRVVNEPVTGESYVEERRYD